MGALSKAWIYEQEPGLTKYAEGDIAKLGNQVKIEALPDGEAARAQAVLDILGALKAEVETLTAAKADLEAKIDPLEAQVKATAAQNAAGEQKVTMASSKLDEMSKKLTDLMAEVDKVKRQGVVVAGVAGDGAAAADAADGGLKDGPDVGGEPEADFGLGGDAFGGDTW